MVSSSEKDLDDKNNFNNIDIVIGSHVFEHLVDPINF